jgi:lipopolysaccharide transport protein LptA
MVMSGKVQRLEFGNQTFDVWLQAKGYGPDPGLLYQVRSEYFVPRADIEARLLNQEIVVSGWPARGDSHGLCSPVCGIYAEMMWLENGSSLKPGSNRPISPPPVAPAAQPSPTGGHQAEPAGLVLQPRISHGPIKITAHALERFQDGRGAVYSGDVQMTEGDSRQATDKLTVTCQSDASQQCKEIRTMIAEGNVAFTFPDASIRSDHAEYDYAARSIAFTGDVVVERNGGVLRGPKVIYAVDDKRITVTGNPAASKKSPN